MDNDYDNEFSLLTFELITLSRMVSKMEGSGISAIDDDTKIVQGRPYLSIGIILRKEYCLRGTYTFASIRSRINMQ